MIKQIKSHKNTSLNLYFIFPLFGHFSECFRPLLEVESTHIGVFNLKGLHPQLKEFGSSSKLPNKLFKEITQRLQKGKVLGLKNIILATFCSLEYACFGCLTLFLMSWSFMLHVCLLISVEKGRKG